MNRTIAQYLKDKIAERHYAGVVAGIVTPVRVKGADGKRTNTYAIDCGVIGQDCMDKEGLTAIMPDTAKRSIFYFEDPSGVLLTKVEGRFRHFSSTLILVGWLNLPKLGLTSEDGCKGCTWGYRIYNDIISMLPAGENIGEECPMVDLEIQFTRQYPRSHEVFRRYTFGEEHRQFRLPPYDYFAIELTCKWRASERCVGQVPENPPIEC